MKLSKWRVIESQCLIQDRWLRLRADRCVTASGASIYPYYVFEYPDWVTVFPVTRTGELILVRQYRHGRGEMFLELPGGRFEADDVTAVAVAKRELREETGYSGEAFEEIATVAPDATRLTNLTHVVIATGLERTASPQLDHGEDVEVVLMPLESVSSELRKGTFAQAAPIYFALAHLRLIP